MYLDGTFAFGLAAISAVPLRVGQLLTQTEIDSLKGADLEEKAKEVALRFIEYRPRSTAETRQHLLKKEYPEDVVERVIERLTAVELLNDAAFANYWVEQRQTFKPRSQLAIQQELRQKGVERQAIDDALQSVDGVTAATRAAEPKARRWQGLPEEEFFKKVGSYLQRRGFSYDIVKEVTATLWEEVNEQDEEANNQF